MEKQQIDTIGARLIERKETIAVAESVTSGNIQAALSLGEQASRFLQGGITVYNLGQKARHLDIEPIEAEATNSVSEEIARQMALNVCKMFLSDYGIGITGYASPFPEKDINDLFAYACITHKGEVLVMQKLTCDKDTPKEAQLFYTDEVLRLLDKVI